MDVQHYLIGGGITLVLFFLISKIINQPKRKFSFDQHHTFLVTGAASGIGKTLVENLLERKQSVIALDLNLPQLQKNASEWSKKYGIPSSALHASANDRVSSTTSQRLFIEKLDITYYDEWKRVYSSALTLFPHIDFHCNMAGYLQPGYADSLGQIDIDRHIDINVKGLIYGTQTAAKSLKGDNLPTLHIINIGSLASLIPYPGCSLYGTSKAAVRSFSLAANYELRHSNVKITCVCPDAVQTPMLDLQLNYDEASATFSNSLQTLTADDVVKAIFERVIPYQPYEEWIPRSRGYLIRFGDTIYGSRLWEIMMDISVSMGRAKRLKMKKEAESSKKKN